MKRKRGRQYLRLSFIFCLYACTVMVTTATQQKLSIAQTVENINQAISIKYNNRVYELKQQGHDVIVLSLGEAFFDIPLFSMGCLPYPALYHYSHSRGIVPLREKVSAYYCAKYGVTVDPAQEIIITAGSKAALYFALLSIINSGDEVLIHEPAWVSFTEQVRLCNGIPIGIPYWQTVYDYEQYITEKTRVIIVNNPQNPSGKVFTKKELAHIVALARKHNLFVIADEAYSDFVDKEPFYSLGSFDTDKQHIIVCNSLSKNCGMSGWRIGYVIAHNALIDQILKINQHVSTCPATILEWYVAHYFNQIMDITHAQIKKVLYKRNKIARMMDDIGLSYLPGTGTFYFFVSIAPSILSSEEFCTKLLEDVHICVVPGSGYGQSCDTFIRLSVGTESIERISHALRTIKELIEKTTESNKSKQYASVGIVI